MNVFCFAGNITKDIELRSTPAGKQVANFSIAINEGKDQTTFLNCIAWEKTGELINQYCKKGDRLSGSGRIQVRKWEDKEGKTVYATEVVIMQFDFPPKSKEQDKSQDAGGITGNMPSSRDDEMADMIPF